MFVKPLIKIIALLTAIYALVRGLYLLINRDFFFQERWLDIVHGFVVGMRFDIAIITAFILPLLLIIYVPIPWLQRQPAWHYVVRTTFTALQSFGILSNLVDIEFINTTGRRLTVAALFDLRADITPQLGQLLTSYAYLIVLWLAFSYLVWRASAWLTDNRMGIVANTVHVVVLVPVLVLAYRGGLQPKVLHPAHANSFMENPAMAEFALNGPFHFLRNPDAERITAPQTFESYAAALSALKPAVPSSHPKPLPRNTNVVIFIIESLSAEYMGDRGGVDYTPFLSDLRARSASFFGVANGQTSIESLAPILLGIPSILPNAYITSMYQNNRVVGLATSMRTLGYDTSFFHGGQKGTMFFDAYAKLAGFEHYLGMENYPTKDHFDGAWGIYDHYFLDFMAKDIRQKSKPFLSVMFTLSSHPPYRIPPEFKDRFPKGPLRIHQTLGYVDQTFREFFAKHANEAWFKNTLFVFMADHTQTPHNRKFMNDTGRKMIPIFFYHPTIDLKPYANPTKVMQQADITASIYDLLGHPELKSCVLSKSVFNSNDERGHAMFKVRKCVYQVEGGKEISYYRICDGKLRGPYDFIHDGAAKLDPLPSDRDPAQVKRARAATQVFFQGILENRLFD